MVHELNDQNFHSTVDEESRPVVVDLWAPWCGPCRAIAPIVEKLSKDNKDVVWSKLNIDDNPKTTIEYGVQSIPTLIVFKEGVEVGRVVGFAGPQQLQDQLNKFIG